VNFGTAGAYTVNIGGAADILADDTLTVDAGGSGTADSVTIANTNAATGTNQMGSATTTIVATDFETVTINTGSYSTATAQLVNTVNVGANTLVLTGSNGLITTAGVGTGIITAAVINASAMTGSLVMNAAAASVTSITGGSAGDTLRGDTSSTINGGEGGDVIVGGSGNDVLNGDAGNDTITTDNGTDNVNGGEGDDTVVVATYLSAADVVNGGAGNDTLRIGQAATAEASQGVTNFEILQADDALTQDMVLFTVNPTFTRLVSNTNGAVSFVSVGANTNELRAVSTAATLMFDRLLDNSSNALTFGAASNAAATINALTVNDEETLSINAGGITTAGTLLTITTLNADDLQTLNISGVAAVTITNAIAGANDSLATVNASSNTGAVNVSAASSTIAMTVTGSATAANTFTTGSGADVITGGSAGDNLTGGANNDTINGGGGSDTLDGGTGNDSLTGGEGADQITGGAGNDAIILTETTAASDTVVFAASADNGVDTITSFATGATGDVMNHYAATQVGVAAAAPIAAVGFIAGAEFLSTVLTADAAHTLTSGDVIRLIDIVDGQDITTAAGLQTALRTGEYASVNGTAFQTSVIITSTSAAAGTNYVFHVTGAALAEAVTLVGTISNVQIGSFDAANFLV
jgi:Ca2+-binding RTX toxin-like protein